MGLDFRCNTNVPLPRFELWTLPLAACRALTFAVERWADTTGVGLPPVRQRIEPPLISVTFRGGVRASTGRPGSLVRPCALRYSAVVARSHPVVAVRPDHGCSRATEPLLVTHSTSSPTYFVLRQPQRSTDDRGDRLRPLRGTGQGVSKGAPEWNRIDLPNAFRSYFDGILHCSILRWSSPQRVWWGGPNTCRSLIEELKGRFGRRSDWQVLLPELLLAAALGKVPDEGVEVLLAEANVVLGAREEGWPDEVLAFVDLGRLLVENVSGLA